MNPSVWRARIRVEKQWEGDPWGSRWRPLHVGAYSTPEVAQGKGPESSSAESVIDSDATEVDQYPAPAPPSSQQTLNDQVPLPAHELGISGSAEVKLSAGDHLVHFVVVAEGTPPHNLEAFPDLFQLKIKSDFQVVYKWRLRQIDLPAQRFVEVPYGGLNVTVSATVGIRPSVNWRLTRAEETIRNQGITEQSVTRIDLPYPSLDTYYKLTLQVQAHGRCSVALRLRLNLDCPNLHVPFTY
ncbi:hypothetical protein CC2G_006669 [Coprinopsis cinerea AmutBmut pab1-1]|nr:hypothetical protein CC2G_006669 [Coprinopsis cinerea AmutBmut pab1-1]